MAQLVKSVRRDRSTKNKRPLVAAIEAVEARRLMAYVAAPAADQIVASGSNVPGVDSAAARPDATNNTRYISFTEGGNALVVGATGGYDAVNNISTTAHGTPVQANGDRSQAENLDQTDVAANGVSSNTYVVVWRATPIGANGTAVNHIDAEVFSNGINVSGIIRVSSQSSPETPRVAMDAGGNFTVVWAAPVNGTRQIFLQRYDSSGSANGSMVQVSTDGGSEPDVAVSAGGGIAVTWATPSGVSSQLYDRNLQALGAVQTIAADAFAAPAVGILPDGSYLVAYSTTVASIKNVLVQRYDETGAASGAPFAAAVDTTVNQNVPEVAVDTSGDYVVGWAQATAASPNVYSAIGVRVFTSDNTAADPESVIANASFGTDFRFGLAFRVADQFDVAYGDGAGGVLDQTYSNDSAAAVTPTPPAGALSISVTTASTITVTNDSSTIFVTINGVTTSYSRGTYSSIFVSGSGDADDIDLRGFTLPSQIYAGDGNDTIYGGSGADSITAGAGDDAVQAGAGDDTIYGNEGNDTLFGADGNDYIVGGPGKNKLYGENGFDTLIAGNRGDALYGGAGGDSLVGGVGYDYLEGDSSNDTLFGNGGNDILLGGNGNDYLDGGAGNDSVVGGNGKDYCYGGPGNDTLVGGALADTLKGGDGSDIAYFDTLDTNISIDFRILVK